jgi:nucleoside-diphosphate-sugar epimerase
MRVLLTGASGFIGRQVLAQLALRGIDTVAVGGARAAGFQGEFIEADLLQADACVDVVARAHCTHLIHMAWYAEHGQYWASPLNLRWVEASVRLVEAFCAAGGQHVAAAGTCAEYDGSVGYCREDSSPLVPATLYGVAKDATRRLVTAVCDAAGVPCAWGRIFMAYGPGEDRRRLFPSLADVFQGRRAPFGVNAEAYRDFVHVEDVARAFADLSFAAASGSFNIASGLPIQIAQAVRLIAQACGAAPAAVLDLATERPGEPRLLLGDNGRLLSLGWRAVQPFHPFRP